MTENHRKLPARPIDILHRSTPGQFAAEKKRKSDESYPPLSTFSAAVTNCVNHTTTGLINNIKQQ